MSKKKSRAISWMVLVVFSLVIFCTSAFIIIHADHDCSDDKCTICMELAQCRKTLDDLGSAITGAVHITLMVCVVALMEKVIIKSRSEHSTLISLKVELLN